jgi:ankyrin repeat protein
MMAGPTPLLAAVYRADRATVERLLAGGATPTLYEAAALGDAARIRTLARTTPAAVAERSPDGWPPLHLAAYFGHGDAVDALLEARADVRAYSTNDEGNTALHAALAGRRDHRIVSRLLASGAEVNARAAGGYTPLHIAAFHDDLGVIETLLAHGAAADAREDQGRTPLAIAEDQGQKQVARRLRGEMP